MGTAGVQPLAPFSEGSFADQLNTELHNQRHADTAVQDRAQAKETGSKRQFLPPAQDAAPVPATIAEPVAAVVAGAPSVQTGRVSGDAAEGAPQPLDGAWPGTQPERPLTGEGGSGEPGGAAMSLGLGGLAAPVAVDAGGLVRLSAGGQEAPLAQALPAPLGAALAPAAQGVAQPVLDPALAPVLASALGATEARAWPAPVGRNGSGLVDGASPLPVPSVPVQGAAAAAALPVPVQDLGPVVAQAAPVLVGGGASVVVRAEVKTEFRPVARSPVLAWAPGVASGSVSGVASAVVPAQGATEPAAWVPGEALAVDALAAAEQMQALFNDAAPRSGAARGLGGEAVALQAAPLGAPALPEARAVRAEPAPSPAAAAALAWAAEGAGDGVWRSSPTDIDGLHLDLSFDGSGRALVVVQTDNDVLGQSLRERTAELQEAMELLGLRVDVDVRHGDARSGSSFSQRGRGLVEPPLAPPFDPERPRTVVPPTVQRALAGGLSLSVYA